MEFVEASSTFFKPPAIPEARRIIELPGLSLSLTSPLCDGTTFGGLCFEGKHTSRVTPSRLGILYVPAKAFWTRVNDWGAYDLANGAEYGRVHRWIGNSFPLHANGGLRLIQVAEPCSICPETLWQRG